MRKKTTYIEEINFHEFKRIFELYPIVTIEIIKDIIHFDLAVKEEPGGAGGVDYDKVHAENRVEKRLQALVTQLNISKENIIANLLSLMCIVIDKS